jgi:hypothetical protein
VLVLHVAASRVEAWDKFRGCQQLPWQVVARVEGWHDELRLSQKNERP